MSDPQFDIIIVGGGTAGCVLASRLSAIPRLRILLLEAGSNRNGDAKVRTPLLSRRMFKDPDYDWGYETVPQTTLDDRVIQHTRGRMIGGSSAINSHSLVFPNKDMHDTWAEIVADERWCWDQMKDCYTQFHEEIRISDSPDTMCSSAKTKPSKPVKASYPQQLNQLQMAWTDAFEALDMKSKSTGVSGACLGGFTTTNAIDSRPRKGERSHAGIAYLQPALGRENLVVETDALVEQVVFQTRSSHDSAPLTAIGVAYEKEGRKIFAKANQEIIVCAGVFGSPQLLELSGIGSRGILEKAGIECILDLPEVGENLQDHLNFGPSIEVRSEVETLDAAVKNPTTMAAYQEQYLQSQTGPLAEGGAYSFAFWPLQLFNTPAEEAELKTLLESYNIHERTDSQSQREAFIKRMILSPSEASATVFMIRIQRYTDASNKADGNYMTVVAMLAHPFSRGSTHIQTADPKNHPKIDCAYLSHPLDAKILARHCLQIERLLEQPTYASIIKPGGTRLPRGYETPFETVDQVKPAIRQHGATNYHPCGTCAMAAAGEGVVDGSLRVHGTSNLRVCDASVFPIIPRGNILTTVYAVAEKAAEFLLEEYTRGSS